MTVKLSPPRMMGSVGGGGGHKESLAVLGGMAIVTAEQKRPCVSHSGNTVSEWKRRDIFHSYSVKIYLKCRS